MEERQKQHTDTQNRRWPWLVVAAFLLMVIAARLSLKSSVVHELVRNQILQVSGEMLDGELRIGSLKGDLWKQVTFEDIQLVTPTDTVLSVDTLSVRYQVLSYFNSVFRIDQIGVHQPLVSVIEQQDGSFNLEHLLKDTTAAEDDTTSSPFFFSVEHFSITGGALEGRLRSLGADSVVAVRDFLTEGGFGFLPEGYELQLRELSFRVDETRLSPVQIRSAGRIEGPQITLESLVVGTGRSVLESSAEVNTADSTTSLNFSAVPLSWRDLSVYLESFPLQQNLQLDLNLSGTFRAFEVGVTAETGGLQQLELTTGFQWNESLELHHARLNAEELDLATLFADTTYPRMKDLHVSLDGLVDFGEIRQGTLEGTFSARDIRQGDFQIDRFSGDYSLRHDRLKASVNASREKERMQVGMEATRIWNEKPEFSTAINMHNVQPEYWMRDSAYAGTINLSANIDGVGYLPDQRYWDYRLDFKESVIGGQQLAVASLNGQVNGSRFTSRSRIRLKESELNLRAEVNNYLEAPEYEYELNINRLNLAECKGLEELPTAINAQITGKGKYITPEQVQLTSSIRIDSSVVNQEYIERLDAEIQVRDTVAEVSNGTLLSAIADGSFGGRFHLKEWYDIENRVDLDFQVKDLQTFAALADVGTLQSRGSISGKLQPVYEDELQFSGAIDFEDVVYGETLTSDGIRGSVEVLLVEEPEFVLNLDLSNPVINSVVLRDVGTTVRGKVTPDSTYGSLQLMFSSPSENRIQHAATYAFSPEQARIHTMELEIISDVRRLQLSSPFDLLVREHSFHMDTMRIESDDGALLEAAIPHADSTVQRGYLMGRNLNLTVIQNTLLNDAYFEGMLSGRIFIERQDTMLSSSGDLQIEDLVYEGTALDSLALRYQIQNERLEGGLLLYDGDERLARGQLRVPFKLGDPNAFGSSFFEEEVFGFLETKELSANRFQQMLTDAGITNSSGTMLLSGQLRGTAGKPEIDATFRMKEASISGVAVDSIRATLDYNHADRAFMVNGSVTSLSQKAAEISASVPAYLDLKDFNLVLPDQDDSVQVDITTNQFNLASLNDFVDRTEIREVQGLLDGNVSITGPLSGLSARGQLDFREGAVRIVEAGVKISEIESVINFNGNRVQVEKMQARSGNGTFTAGGTMNFDELQPGTLDLEMAAENFRIANTAEYSAIIDMDTQLGGTLAKPDVKGELSFVSGYIYLQNFGEKSVETVELDADSASENYSAYAQYDSLSLNMDVSFNRRFYVRNQRYLDLEYELDGQVDLVKDRGDDLELFGTLEASSGYARPLGKRFQLEEGVITFDGTPANPQLNIRHLFEPPQQELGDVQIWYIIEGRVEDPLFKYESEPEMGLEDIISYTLFGKPFMSLDPWKQVVANSGSNISAADVAMDVLLDKVETLATQRLGIDVVQIDNTRSGTNSGTSIKTGWYLNPRVFFAIQNEITGSTPDTVFILEYLLKKDLKLIITQGSDSQTGLDLRWNYDY
ncbi:translocation/assembly module TamB domain-containing protein [Halalkalibaculum sp. DA3122]|uniref:translocation/assembly module TamB domain-containing protein n=1 Tax=Halalkalibaculum sp. DA3122 TaxID=3373607 RepID=UPI003754CD24